MIKYLNSQECKPMLSKLIDLANKKFKEDLRYEIDERTQHRNDSPHTLCCAAYDTEKDEIVSYASWTVSDMKFREGLLNGKYEDNDLYPYDGSSAPILVFDAFVVTDKLHAPIIIRKISKDLHALVVADELNIVGGLSIGGLRFTEKWLAKFGFKSIGDYQDKYPILWATREESAMLNSLVKVYN